MILLIIINDVLFVVKCASSAAFLKNTRMSQSLSCQFCGNGFYVYSLCELCDSFKSINSIDNIYRKVFVIDYSDYWHALVDCFLHGQLRCVLSKMIYDENWFHILHIQHVSLFLDFHGKCFSWCALRLLFLCNHYLTFHFYYVFLYV